MSSRDFGFLTLRNVTAYQPNNLYVPPNNIFVTTTNGVARFSDNITISSINVSTLNHTTVTGSTISVLSILASSISTGYLTASVAGISSLSVSSLTATNENVLNINASSISTGYLTASVAGISSLSVSSLSVNSITGTNASFSSLNASTANITSLNTSSIMTSTISSVNMFLSSLELTAGIFDSSASLFVNGFPVITEATVSSVSTVFWNDSNGTNGAIYNNNIGASGGNYYLVGIGTGQSGVLNAVLDVNANGSSGNAFNVSTNSYFFTISSNGVIGTNGTISSATLLANNGSISTLTVSSLSVNSENVSNLNALTISSGNLFASNAGISTLGVSSLSVNSENVSSLNASSISTGYLFASIGGISTLAVSSLTVNTQNVSSLNASSISTGYLFASIGGISTLAVSSLSVNSENISSLNASSISTGYLFASNAGISTLAVSSLSVNSENVSSLNASSISTGYLFASNAGISTLTVNTINGAIPITQLTAGYDINITGTAANPTIGVVSTPTFVGINFEGVSGITPLLGINANYPSTLVVNVQTEDYKSGFGVVYDDVLTVISNIPDVGSPSWGMIQTYHVNGLDPYALYLQPKGGDLVVGGYGNTSTFTVRTVSNFVSTTTYSNSADIIMGSGSQIGINQPNPAFPLDVAGNANIASTLTALSISTGNLFTSNAGISTLGVNSLTVNNISSTKLIISSANVGINQPNPAYPLDVAGSANIASTLYVSSINMPNGTITSITQGLAFTNNATDFTFQTSDNTKNSINISMLAPSTNTSFVQYAVGTGGSGLTSDTISLWGYPQLSNTTYPTNNPGSSGSFNIYTMKPDGSSVTFGNASPSTFANGQGCDLSVIGLNSNGNFVISRVNDPFFNPVTSLNSLTINSNLYLNQSSNITFNNINIYDTITPYSSTTYTYWVPSQSINGFNGTNWGQCPNGTSVYISSFSNNYASTLLTNNNFYWNCPISGIWNITMAVYVANGGKQIALGNFTNNKMIIPAADGTGTTTTYIAKNNNILLAGWINTGFNTTGDNNQSSIITYTLLQPLNLSNW
jgi:hypothetical protein